LERFLPFEEPSSPLELPPPHTPLQTPIVLIKHSFWVKNVNRRPNLLFEWTSHTPLSSQKRLFFLLPNFLTTNFGNQSYLPYYLKIKCLSTTSKKHTKSPRRTTWPMGKSTIHIWHPTPHSINEEPGCQNLNLHLATKLN